MGFMHVVAASWMMLRHVSENCGDTMVGNVVSTLYRVFGNVGEKFK